MQKMILKKIALLIFTSTLILAACNSREQDERQADLRLQKVQALIAENKLNEAKSEIDSIHFLFQRLVSKRKMAVALQDTIILRESYRTESYCNKLLPELESAYNKLSKNFVLQKNEKYEEIGKYVYKSQLGEQNTGRNYLKYEVDENGDLFLTSMYCGSKINHFAVTVETAVMRATTDTSNKNNGVFHAFNVGDNYFEQLTFKNEADNGIGNFIKANKNLTLKVTLTGSRKISYVLNATDKEAISETIVFAQAQKLLKKTANDLRIAQQRIGKIKLLYQE